MLMRPRPIWNLFFIIFLVDRVGRKKPLLFGSFMLAACLAVETAINAQVRLFSSYSAPRI